MTHIVTGPTVGTMLAAPDRVAASLPHIDKIAYGPGPWSVEPDKVQWTAHGFVCLMVRNQMGAWCGYVGVPRGHHLFGTNYDDVEHAFDTAHGGLTYSGMSVVNHPVSRFDELGAEPVWFLGFDCSHGGDYIPSIAAYMLSSFRPSGSWPLFHDGVYRDAVYVERCVDAMALSLKEFRGEDPAG
jgi:hypothetical protein